MFNFLRKKMPHPDGLDSTYYAPGYVFTGGAENLAYINLRPHPLLTPFAGFLTNGQLRVTDAQTVYQYNALPVQSILPGVPAGQLTTTELLASGQLPNTPNNVVANNALFGGVQS